MFASPQPAPPEKAAPPVIAALFTEFIPNVKNDYELLERASESSLKISMPDLQMETLIFGLHCLDRAVLAHHGAAYRASFMDCALDTACEAFASVLPSHVKGHFVECFKEHYNIRQREYGGMKLLAGDERVLKGVLAFEYAKRICFDAGVHNPAVHLVIQEGANSIFIMMDRVAQSL